MKQEIPPAVIAAVIVVVVLIVGFLGIKLFSSGREGGTSAQDMQKRMAQHPGGYSGGAPGSGGQMRGAVNTSGMSSSAGYPGNTGR